MPVGRGELREVVGIERIAETKHGLEIASYAGGCPR